MKRQNALLYGTGAVLVTAGLLGGSAAEAHENTQQMHKASRIIYCLQRTEQLSVDSRLQHCLEDKDSSYNADRGSVITDRTFNLGEPISDVATYGNALAKDAHEFNIGISLLGGVVGLAATAAVLSAVESRTESRAKQLNS